MPYDLKTNSWGYDIRRFERYKNMFDRVARHEGEWADKYREHLRKWMSDIQKQWPQFIKVDEIP